MNAKCRFGKLELYLYKPYMKEVLHLTEQSLKSPLLQKVLQQIHSVHDALRRGEEPSVPLTKHGETRIRHVVKFDLAGAYRLVLWRHNSLQVPLFVGSHDRVEAWLTRFKGANFTFHTDDRRGEAAVDFRITSGMSQAVAAMESEAEESPIPYEPLNALRSLDDRLFADLGITPERVTSLKESVRSDVPPDIRRFLALNFANGDEERATALLAAFEHARRGKFNAARMDLRVAAGKTRTADDDPEGFVRALAGITAGSPITRADEHALAVARRLVDSGTVDDWMLYLAPPQRRIAEASTSGPSRLLGISGSGKTSVLLHRARILAERYPRQKILVVTLNPSLARYLSHLLDRLCAGMNCRTQIEVRPLVDVCTQIAALQPGPAVRMLDPRSGENAESSWNDFIEKFASTVQSIVDALGSDDRARGCSPTAYIREELRWIRSGWSCEARPHYDVAERKGRAIPFPKSLGTFATSELRSAFPSDTRPKLRALLGEFEHWMNVGAVYDSDGISMRAHSAIRTLPRPSRSQGYRCILVDEMQDVSTLELEILNWLVLDPADGLFLCGDLAQKVFPKHHDHGMARLNFVGRGYKLEQNFRNTREILEAAHALIEQFKADAVVEDGGILDPKYATRTGEVPHLVECESRAQQVRYATSMVACLFCSDVDRSSTCIVSHDELTLREVEASFAASHPPIPTLRLSPLTKFNDDRSSVRIAQLEDVKGFEFRTVMVLDASDPRRAGKGGSGREEMREGLPTAGVPWGERWRDAFKLYVAMSRARENLFVTYVYNRSPLLAGVAGKMQEQHASEWIEREGGRDVPKTASSAGAKSPPPCSEIAACGKSDDQTTAAPMKHPGSSKAWAPDRGVGWDMTDQHGDRIVWHDD